MEPCCENLPTRTTHSTILLLRICACANHILCLRTSHHYCEEERKVDKETDRKDIEEIREEVEVDTEIAPNQLEDNETAQDEGIRDGGDKIVNRDVGRYRLRTLRRDKEGKTRPADR
jgi:hypothetical protein